MATRFASNFWRASAVLECDHGVPRQPLNIDHSACFPLQNGRARAAAAGAGTSTGWNCHQWHMATAAAGGQARWRGGAAQWMKVVGLTSISRIDMPWPKNTEGFDI